MEELLAEPPPQPGLRCVWIGPTTDGLNWLVHRLTQTQFCQPQTGTTPLHLRRFPSLQLDDLLRLVEHGEIDRLILACDTRLSYPAAMIQCLQRTCPDVPMAVACSSWWDGFRRTGMGPVGHLALPWYRWWDGWTAWLVGDMREPLPPAAARSVTRLCTAQTRLRNDLAASPTQSPTTPRWGLVVGNCRHTCETWSHVARSVGYSVRSLSWSAFLQSPTSADAAAHYEWIVWDDSCLNTTADRRDGSQSLPPYITAVQSALPRAQWIAALSLPRADEWLAIPKWEQCEWIVKPDSGHGLLRLLTHLSEQPPD
jgi:hypothetical protein